MILAQTTYFNHVSSCQQCALQVTHGYVSQTCLEGFRLFNDAMEKLSIKSEQIGNGVSLGQAWLDRISEEYQFHLHQDNIEAIENFQDMTKDLRSQVSAWAHTLGTNNEPQIQGVLAHLDSLTLKFGAMMGGVRK